MIRIENVSKYYRRKKALSHVSLELPRGQIVGLFGENGAGKSTLMKAILGLLSFQGKVLRTLPDGTTYMVMEFCPGVMLDHNTVMTDQMYSLGRACGQIHRTFSALPP